jgi:tRNA (Thr-GGU) A37 N-methylase
MTRQHAGCFGCGAAHASGLGLDFVVLADGSVQGAWQPRSEFQSYDGIVHGGVIATRAPCRPNPIGLSLVRLLAREGNVLHIEGVDVLDGTPLLDIKPGRAAVLLRVESVFSGREQLM